jgi:hypothetical protein
MLRKLSATLLAVCAVALAGTLSAPSALAAGRITGCFTYEGYYLEGVALNLEYYSVSGWKALRNTAGHTEKDGCATYRIQASQQSLNIRMRARAWASDYHGFLSGASRYAGPNNHLWRLGVNALRLYVLPQQVPPAPAPNTTTDWTIEISNWLNDITDPSSANCSQSAAMVLACYIDQHHLNANVAYLESDPDLDGYSGAEDRYPYDASRT